MDGVFGLRRSLTSSMKTIEGWYAFASANSAFTAFSALPIHLEEMEEEET